MDFVGKLPISMEDLGLLYYAFASIGKGVGSLKTRRVASYFSSGASKDIVSRGSRRLVNAGFLEVVIDSAHDCSGQFTPKLFRLTTAALSLFTQAG